LELDSTPEDITQQPLDEEEEIIFEEKNNTSISRTSTGPLFSNSVPDLVVAETIVPPSFALALIPDPSDCKKRGHDESEQLSHNDGAIVPYMMTDQEEEVKESPIVQILKRSRK
jgi:hypothetical protein